MRTKETLFFNDFTFQSDENGEPKIHGLAISPGIYHDVLTFPESEIKNAASSLNSGVPLLTNHKNLVENAVGRVKKGFKKKMDDNGQYAAYYEGFIDSEEKDILRKINKGIVDSTSIGFMCDHICNICGNDYYSSDCPHWPWDEGFGLTAKNVEVLELSVVSIPADSNASVSTTFSSSEMYNQFKSKYPDLAKLKNKLRNELEEKSVGANKMDYEKKYNDEVSKNEELTKSHGEEINELKSGHEVELSNLKTSNEEKLASERETVINLRQSEKDLKTDNEQLKEKVQELTEELTAIKEVELSEKREKVTELNKNLNATLSEEEISELTESGLDRYIEMFSSIEEKRPTIKQDLHANPAYEGIELGENASASDRLFARTKNLQKGKE